MIYPVEQRRITMVINFDEYAIQKKIVFQTLPEVPCSHMNFQFGMNELVIEGVFLLKFDASSLIWQQQQQF